MKVREGESEVVVQEGKKKFKFERDESGEMKIVSAEGLEEASGGEQSLLERLRAAKPDTCAFCLRAEVNSWIWKMLLLEILDEEDFYG